MIAISVLQEYYLGTAYTDAGDITMLEMLRDAGIQRLGSALNQAIGEKTQTYAVDSATKFIRIPIYNVPITFLTFEKKVGGSYEELEEEDYTVEVYGAFRYVSFKEKIVPKVTYKSGFVEGDCPASVKHMLGKLVMIEAQKIGMIGQPAKLLKDGGNILQTVTDGDIREELSDYYFHSL